MSYLFIRIF